MHRDTLISNLRKILDLNLYEAKVYLALIAHGAMKKNELFKKAQIPQSRAYDIVLSLKDKGLVTSSLLDGKEFFKSLDIEKSIPAYLTQLRWDHDAQLEEKRKNFEKSLQESQEKFFQDFSSREELSEKVLEKLTPLQEKDIPVSDELFQIIKGETNFVNHIAENVKESSKVIKNISLPQYLPEALIWENLRSKLDGGSLEYFHLAYSGLLLEWGLWRIRGDLGSGVRFRFLPHTQMREKFYLFDDKSCFMRLEDPLTGKLSDQGIVFKEPLWVNDHLKKFDVLWEKGHDFEDLVEKIQEQKETAFQKLSEKEQTLMEAILERGRYTTTKELGLEDVSTILSSLYKKGYIVPFKKALLGYIANIDLFLGEEHNHLSLEHEAI